MKKKHAKISHKMAHFGGICT